jgi:uncharacterized protein YbjT (DUF2867 family)
MIVVTTPTGHIGSQLVAALLAAGEPVRVVARTPDKLAPGVRAKVDVVQGSSDDEGVLDRALAGAKGFFHCVPPDFRAPEVDEYYLRFTRPAIAAMKKNGVAHVVSVSAVGRGAGVEAGVVSSALRKDAALEDAGLHVRALWCPGFMENMFMSIDSLRSQGAFFGPSLPEVKRPYVATKDIAATAARLLRDRSWRGPGGVAVLGPEDLSLDDMAAILSDVLGRPIRYQQVPADAYKAQLLKFGASEGFAQGLVDMHEAKDRGLDDTVPRDAENTTPTSFRAWCTAVLRPALESGAGGAGH